METKLLKLNEPLTINIDVSAFEKSVHFHKLILKSGDLPTDNKAFVLISYNIGDELKVDFLNYNTGGNINVIVKLSAFASKPTNVSNVTLCLYDIDERIKSAEISYTIYSTPKIN